MNDGIINRPCNSFRDVPYSESTGDHIYYTFRHFPDLSVSASGAQALVNNSNCSDLSLAGMKSTRRKVQLKYTHHLEELCKSSLQDNGFDKLAKFRHDLSQSRTSFTALQKGFDNSDSLIFMTPLESANDKLAKAAVRYTSTGTNNDLDGFAGIALTIKEFDTQLKRCLCIWLTPKELEELAIAMDGDGNGLIDGVEFVRYFFELGERCRELMRKEKVDCLQRRREFDKSRIIREEQR